MRTHTLALIFILLTTLSPGASLAAGARPDRPDCSTPFRAAYTWLNWLQRGERWEPESAASCFPLTETGLSREEAIRRVVQLKEVADARTWYIPLDDFPDEPGWEDPDTGQARYDILPHLSDVYLERVSGRWRFAPSSLNGVPDLYSHTFTLGLEPLIERIPSWLKWSVLGLAGWQYLGILLLLAVAVPLGRMVGWLFGGVGRAVFRRSALSWGESVVDRWEEPLRLLGAAVIVWVALPQLRLPVKINLTLVVGIKLFAAISVVWALYRLADVVSNLMETRAEGTESRLDDQLVPLVRKLLKGAVLVLGLVFVLQNAGVDVGSLIAGLGIGGLAFALAAKDTLANLFGSMMIFLDRPFQIGDWIVTSGIEGVVEQVGFRSTRVRTFANSLITVPNATIADSVIDNMGERTFRRLKTVLNLTYSTTPEQMQAFVEGVRAILKANPWVRQDYYEVHFYSFGAHSLDVLLYAFLKVPSWSEELRQRHNIFLEIMRLAEAIGVGFAFPTQTLHLESVAAPRELSAHASPSDDELAAAVHAFGPGGASARPDGPHLTDGYFAGVDTVKGSGGADG